MTTPRGERTVRGDGRNFARIMWDSWAPPGWYTEQGFEATADAFNNIDWADITLHSYRHRWRHAPVTRAMKKTKSGSTRRPY